MSDVRGFGAAGDGKMDDTAALEHALKEGDGVLEFDRGDYLITRTITVNLDRFGRTGLVGKGGTPKIIMAGPGPAFHFVGTHQGSAGPNTFKPNVWSGQRLPTVQNLEIEGRHEEADGLLFERVMQPTLEGVLLRQLRNGVHIRERARNVLISHSHIYNNTGIGIFFDELNLHQAIIVGSHVSYCLRGGIKIVGSEIRNLQITGNDIEYNYDTNESESADVWIDSSADHASVREMTISSNTIQARYSPGGANVRIIGHNPERNHKAGLASITGNMIGSQETNIHLEACRGITVTGNILYSGHQRNVLVEGSRNIVLSGNCFDHNPDYDTKELATGVRIVDSTDVNFNGSVIQDSLSGTHTVNTPVKLQRDALVEVVRCDRTTLNGLHLVDGAPINLLVDSSSHTSVTGCSLLESRETPKIRRPLVWRGKGKGNFLSSNVLSPGLDGEAEIAEEADVQVGTNRVN